MTPRLWTPPLRELTPDTSWGPDFDWFCEHVLGQPNDAWQSWLSLHVGELLDDGRSRFRQALVLVARQQGKTSWARKLTLFWMFVDRAPMILGTSTNRTYAKQSWAAVCDMATSNPYLAAELPGRPVRFTIGEECLTNVHDCEYRFAASNRRAGRSLTVHRAMLDELREHPDFSAWAAVAYAMNAVREAQLVAISNQGDDQAVVLDSLRVPALQYIETGQGDPRLGLFEWSAPQGADPTDLAALAMANPDLGRRTDPDVLVASAMRAVAAGGEELAAFRTEVMCQRVRQLDAAVDPDAWEAAGVDDPVTLEQHRQRTALCLDVALDGSHATLAAAAVVDGVIHVEVVESWDGYGCTQQLRRELPGIVARVMPRALGWFPGGPAAAVAADLAERRASGGAARWPPRRVKVDELQAEAAAVCMGLADVVLAGEVRHPRDAMLTQHTTSAQKLWRGDRWVFTRREVGPVDGAYAAAGAVHLARILPPPPPPIEVVSAGGRRGSGKKTPGTTGGGGRGS